MNKRRRTGTPSRMIALITLLGLLVAPLCAPVCGSRVCADSSTTRGDDCHSSLAASDSHAVSAVASKRACGSQEFPATNLNESTNSIERLIQTNTTAASTNLLAALNCTRRYPLDEPTDIGKTPAHLTALQI